MEEIDWNLRRCYLSREFWNITVYKILEKLIVSRQKYKDERNDLMQVLVDLLMNSLYGVQIGKGNTEF